ncbi:MAG: clostripain-related cysteine peptidase [Thermotogota bacterium]
MKKNVETPLITKQIYNTDFSQYLEFNVKIKNIEINGTSYSFETPSRKVFIERNIIKGNDSLSVKYTDEYGRIWKENVSKKHPEFQMLLWGGGDNNLTTYPNFLGKDIEEIRNGVKNSNSDMIVNVIADFSDDPDTIYNIYSIDGHYYETQESPYYNAEGEINSGDIQTLENYLFEMMSRSKETIKYLDIWNHGNGWIDESNYDDDYANYSLKQIVIDEGNGNSSLKIKEITQLLKNFQVEFEHKIDVFGTDACDMAFIEIIYEFADEINYYVGSVNEEPGDGWDYTFLHEFNGDLENLLKQQIEYYSTSYVSSSYEDFYFYNDPQYAITLSAIKTEGLRNYIQNNLSNILKNNLLIDKKTNEISPYVGKYNRLLDLNLVLNDYKEFNDNFIIAKNVESEDILIDTYNYNVDYLSGIGISYRINTNFLSDYMELQFYEDFINTNKWDFETY